MKHKLISRGSRKAEIIIIHDNGSRETRHLLYKADRWVDKQGNTYRI